MSEKETTDELQQKEAMTIVNNATMFMVNAGVREFENRIREKETEFMKEVRHVLDTLYVEVDAQFEYTLEKFRNDADVIIAAASKSAKAKLHEIEAKTQSSIEDIKSSIASEMRESGQNACNDGEKRMSATNRQTSKYTSGAMSYRSTVKPKTIAVPAITKSGTAITPSKNRPQSAKSVTQPKATQPKATQPKNKWK